MVQDIDITAAIPDGEFKDESPIATVERIKGILKPYGIETEEVWYYSSVPYCHALSVKILGTIFSVNGKGLTKEFALASGYGELMERFQLGYVGGPNSQKDGDHSLDSGKYDMVSAQDMLARNRDWYERMAQRQYQMTGVKMTAEDIVKQYANAEGKIPSTSYFNITKGTREYLPTALRKRVYSTNGCAAGNSMEEAMVQAISEVVERHHQIRIIDEGICLPDIPEEELKKYKVAYNIISFVRSQGYRVIVKDCSLGTKFPVVCVCFINEKTGKYHTHFGAYPIFEIALERSLTESFQGRNIQNIAKFENFLYRKPGEYSFASISNEFTKGSWEKMTCFFVGQPQYAYNASVGFTGRKNKELLRECVEFFAEQGYDVLVRNCSSLGFHTYQILIPGYSEAFIHRLCQNLDDHRYSSYAVKTLRNPSAAGIQDYLGLLMHLEQMKNFTASVNGVHGFLASAKLCAKLSKAEENYLMSASLAYVYYALGRHSEVIKCIDAMIPESSGQDTEYLICLKRYLSMLANRCGKDEIRKVLEFFHRGETVEALYACLANNTNPMDRFTLHCDMSCTEDCKLYKSCFQKRSKELTDMINEKMKALSFEEFSRELQALM